MFGYTKLKGQIEEDIKGLGFDHNVILRPGIAAGYREESRPAEAVIRKIAGAPGAISSHYLKDRWAQDADVIAKAAVKAELKALDGEAPSRVWVIKGRDIIREAQCEWIRRKQLTVAQPLGRMKSMCIAGDRSSLQDTRITSRLQQETAPKISLYLGSNVPFDAPPFAQHFVEQHSHPVFVVLSLRQSNA